MFYFLFFNRFISQIDALDCRASSVMYVDYIRARDLAAWGDRVDQYKVLAGPVEIPRLLWCSYVEHNKIQNPEHKIISV